MASTSGPSALVEQIENLNDNELLALARNLNPAKRRSLAAAVKDATKRARTEEEAPQTHDMQRYFRALELLDDWRLNLSGLMCKPHFVVIVLCVPSKFSPCQTTRELRLHKLFRMKAAR